jgi:hypothetical protein
MPASMRLISKGAAIHPRRAVEPLQVLTVAALLLAVAVVVILCVEAMISPLAGWANAQTLASLAPV